MELKHPPIFVCGVQRAGTTLLTKMLNRSNRIEFLPQETHLYPLFWNATGKLRPIHSAETLGNLLREKLPKVNFGWTAAEQPLLEITHQIKEGITVPATVDELLAVILRIWEDKQIENVRTGEKTPAHIYYAPKILKAFPDCKMIVMCRDPRAAALSELVKLKNNRRMSQSFDPFNFLVRWDTTVALGQKLSKQPNVIFVKYEDLIVTPEKTLREVTGFLGVDFQEDMLEIGVTNSSFQDRKQRGIRFNTLNVERWTSELPDEIIRLIDHHLGNRMRELGYSPRQGAGAPVSGAKHIKQTSILRTARFLALHAPALFHHQIRNRKYRF